MTLNYNGGLAMKKFNYIMAAVLVAAMSSCAEKIEEPTPGVSRNDYVAPIEGATFSLVASASEENDVDAQSKALFDGNQLVWNSGDALNVFASSENSYEFKFSPKEDADWNKQGNTFYTTVFTPEEGQTYDYTAVFPFQAGLTMDSAGWLHESVDGAPVKKTYSLYTPEHKRNRAHLETMPLYGTAQATGFAVPQLTMHNTVSIIEVEVANKLSLAPMEVTKVKFSSNCISFGGEYYLNAKTGKLELKEGTGKREVELQCNNKEDNGSDNAMINAGDFGYYTIAVAPQTVNGTISVDVTTSQGTISATRTLKDITFNAGRIRKIKLALERNIFVKADADGTKDGSSWENAFSITQFLDYVKQNESDSDNNAIRSEGGNFYFAGGNYAVTERKIEFSGYPRRVKFNVFGGYDPASTGTDISKRDVANNETVFNGNGTNRFLTLGNQTEPTFDGITFANLKSSGEGCLSVAAGAPDARVNFTNCTFKKCTASGGQNPILMVRKGLAKLNNVIFDGCRAEGGVRGLIRLSQNNSRVYLNACTFINNTFGGGGFGLLVHLNEVGGNICMHNVTFAGNDTGCGATGVVNGTGGMLVASSTIVASNDNPAIRCESDPNSGSRLVNSLIIQEKDKTAIDMSSSGRKLKSLGGNVIVGGINVNSQYEASSNDDTFANRTAAAALSLKWNYDSRHYLWNGTTTLTKFTLEQLRSAIKSYSNANTGKIPAGSTEIYDGSKAGEDFLSWLDSINAFDIYGNSSAVWPGSYQGN